MDEKAKLEMVRDVVEDIIFDDIRTAFLEILDENTQKRWAFLSRAISNNNYMKDNIKPLIATDISNKEFIEKTFEVIENA